MDTISCIQKAIDFIEDNIYDELDPDVIASQAYMSSFHFQRVFSILCNISLGEYIRIRRLTLARSEIRETDTKIIDIAFNTAMNLRKAFHARLPVFTACLR